MAAGGSVLVLDGDKLHALDIVRSLGQCGLTVSVGAPARDAIAGASRFAAARLVYPHPARDRDRFIEWLEQELRTGAYRLVMPVTDLTGIPISRELSRLQAYCPIATERFDTIQLVSDKRRTLALAARVGVPVPATMAVHREDEIDGCAALLTYPVVCKPMASSVWTPAGYLSPSVFYALDDQALRRSLPPRVRECPFLVQEFRRGAGMGVEVLARNGEILQAFQHQRLHELPLSGGASTYRMSVPLDPRLGEYTRRLIAEIGWTGVAMVEFKVDLATHEAVLMEINGRFWGSLPLSSRAGMSFAKDLHDMLTTGCTPPARRYAVGVRCRKLRDDLEWFKETAKLRARDPLVAAGIIRKPSARTWLSALLRFASPAEHYDAQTLSDPIPGLIDLRASLRRRRSAGTWRPPSAAWGRVSTGCGIPRGCWREPPPRSACCFSATATSCAVLSPERTTHRGHGARLSPRDFISVTSDPPTRVPLPRHGHGASICRRIVRERSTVS